MKKLIALVISLLISLSIIIAGCSTSSSSTQSASAKPLNIGIATVLSGPAANVGINYQNAVEMAINDQNAKGGVTIGGEKYTLTPIVRDTKMDAATAKSVAQEMVSNEHVKAIFGPTQVDVPAMQDITNADKIFIFGLSAQPATCNTKYPYNFFLGGDSTQMIAAATDYITKAYPQAKSMVSFYGDVPDNSLWASAAQNVCKRYGLNWQGMVKFSTDTTDFSPFAQKLLSYNPDIIDLSACGGLMGAIEGTIVKQIRDAGFTGILMLPTAPPPGTLESLPSNYLNKVVVNAVNLDSPIIPQSYKDFISRAQKQYGKILQDVFPAVYNGASAFFAFLNGQESLDTESWLNPFQNYTWNSVYGKQASWVGEPIYGVNRIQITVYWVSEYKNGQLATSAIDIPQDMFMGK